MDDLLYRAAQYMDRDSDHQNLLSVVTVLLSSVKESPSSVVNNWHPLGFLQLKLGQIPDFGSLKLHIWPNNLRRTQSPEWLIHRHVWELRSHVLVGDVTNRFYDVRIADSDRQATNRIYKVTFAGSESILNKTDDLVECVLSSSERHVAGVTYDVPIQKYHSTTAPLNQLSSTIVLTPKAIRDAPDVIGSIDGADRYRYERSTCDHELLVAILSELEVHLTERHLFLTD